MSLVEFAKQELEHAYPLSGDKEADEMQAMIVEDIIEIVEVFSKQGHSGSTAPYVIAHLEKLLRFELIKPLAGDDNEWIEVADGKYQNKRCSRVFKDTDTGEIYDIEGKVFREPNGCCYTNINSRVPVEFPYTPKTEYVDVAK